MAATPVDEHTEDFEQLAGLAALDVLEGDERNRFEQHRAQCERCQLMVRLDRQTLAGLSLTAPEMDPSPDFKARLMQRAAAELTLTTRTSETTDEPIPLRPSTPRPTDTTARGVGGGVGGGEGPARILLFWRRSPWAGALAAVFALALVTVGAFGYQNQPVARIELHGDAPGTAVVIIKRSGAAELEMRDVPDPGVGFVYEAWVIPPAPGSAPVAAGTVSSGNARVALERDPRGGTVAITREPGRADSPTPPILMSGAVQS
jgi:anti-sigma-K factor RskA